MGNNRSRVAPTRKSHMIDSTTRAQYQNQRELIQLRRKLVNINDRHSDAMARLAFKRYEVKMKSHELRHEHGQRQFRKKLDKLNQQNSTLSMNESIVFNENDESTLECPSLLVHNLTASNEWGKSMIIPTTQFDIPDKTKSFNNFDTSYNSFTQTESFVLNDNLSLKQHTEQMKNAIRIAVAKSKRDSNIIARRDTHKY